MGGTHVRSPSLASFHERASLNGAWRCEKLCSKTMIGKVMKAREAHHTTVLTDAEKVGASDKLGVMPGEKQNVSQQDLRQELQESRESEARLRKIIDTIPTLAWCNLTDGSNDFINRRWSDYTGLSQEEVKRVGGKVAIHPEDLPKWLDQWRSLLASGAGGEIEARLRRHHGAYP